MSRKEFPISVKNRIVELAFKNSNQIKDFAGRIATEYDFEIDHIYPSSKGGPSTFENAQIVAPLTNEIKADNLSWIDNGKEYSIEKLEIPEDGKRWKIVKK